MREFADAQQQPHCLVVLDESRAALIGRAEVLRSFLLEELWVMQLGAPGILRSSADEQVVGQVDGLVGCGGQCPHHTGCVPARVTLLLCTCQTAACHDATSASIETTAGG
eukprot:scaffold54107_cov75-Phaeocystis_antarctica.AAC.5